MKLILHSDQAAALLPIIRARLPDVSVGCCHDYASLPETLDRERPNVLFSIRFAGSAGFPRQAITASPTLRWVAVGGSGTDHLFPWDPLRLTVTHAAGVAAETMAQYGAAAILSFFLGLPMLAKAQRQQRWEPRSVASVKGRTLAILGLGGVGQAMAKLAKALDMRVIGMRARPIATEAVERVEPPERLQAVLREADVVFVCLPLTRHTRGLLDAAALQAMKPGAMLVDVSRGGIVSQAALIQALQTGHLGGLLWTYSKRNRFRAAIHCGQWTMCSSPRIAQASMTAGSCAPWTCFAPMRSDGKRDSPCTISSTPSGLLITSVPCATIEAICKPIVRQGCIMLAAVRTRPMELPMAAPTPSASRQVLDFVCEPTSLQIADDARHFASLLLLDTLGVAAAATVMPPAQIARQAATILYGAGGAGPSARMLFDGRSVSVAGAAFAGAAQLDNLDAHDGCNPTKGHIGVVVIPALFSFAQSVPAVSASEALTALVIGYEIGARAGIALHATASDYHSSGAWNAMAVAAVGARLRRTAGAKIRHAFGIAEYHGPRSQMMRVIDHPTMLHDGSCWGALAGASAVFLAELGFTGAPALTLESDAVEAIWRDIGTTWYVTRQYIKPYPVCRWAHPLVDAALRLRALHQLSADDIAGVELTTFHEASRLYQGMPESSPVAQYAIAFPVAAALVAGKLGVTEVDGPALRDAAIQRLVDVTDVRVSDVYNCSFPADRCGDVTLLLNNGERVASGVTSARGGPDNPLSETEIVTKFRDYAGPALGPWRAGRLEQAVRSLPDRSGDFAPIVELACQAVGN